MRQHPTARRHIRSCTAGLGVVDAILDGPSLLVHARGLYMGLVQQTPATACEFGARWRVNGRDIGGARVVDI